MSLLQPQTTFPTIQITILTISIIIYIIYVSMVSTDNERYIHDNYPELYSILDYSKILFYMALVIMGYQVLGYFVKIYMKS